MMIYNYELTVRGYELDSFGHVNNAVYLSYMEQARWEILKAKDLFPFFLEHKLFLVVTETLIRYSYESKLFDVLKITTELKRENPYLIFKHKIYNKETNTIISKATVKTLLVDDKRIPHDIPDEFI